MRLSIVSPSGFGLSFDGDLGDLEACLVLLGEGLERGSHRR